MEFHRIKAAGVELEGGWIYRPTCSVQEDGSIKIERGAEAPSGDSINYVGEAPSPPCGSPDELFAWMDSFYPDLADASCGMHVHISFKSPYTYLRAMDKAFHIYIREGLKEWGKREGVMDNRFWARVEGLNRFCDNVYAPMRQVRGKGKNGSRYTFLNYCYERYGTIELRVFPQFHTYGEAVRAIKAYFSLVEEWMSYPPVNLKRRRVVELMPKADRKPQNPETQQLYLGETSAREEQHVLIVPEYAQNEAI